MSARLEDRPLIKDLKRDAILSGGAGLVFTAIFGLALGNALGLGLSHASAATAFYAAYMAAAWPWLMDNKPALHSLGPANRVTIFRAALVANVGALCLAPGAAAGWAITLLALATFSLDAVDGTVARRYGVASRFGAGFDAELDALFTLILAVLVFRMERAGAFVLVAGAWRYVFLLLMWFWPLFGADLPYSSRRRVVCGVQVGALVLSMSPLVAQPLSGWIAAASVSLLSLSFAIDIAWLVRQHAPRGPRS
jgi:phosphatidylglycerophosphate synthase